MLDDADEKRFLREQAHLLRSLAHKYRLPPDNELVRIAEDSERLAHDLERWRR